MHLKREVKDTCKTCSVKKDKKRKEKEKADMKMTLKQERTLPKVQSKEK